LKNGIRALAAAGNTTGRGLQRGVDLVDGGATMTLSGAIPGTRMPSATQYTIAEGVSAGAGAGLAYSLGAGVYVWSKNPGFEVGLYGSISIGFVTNIGAGIGVQYAYLFGPAPSVLAGDSITVQVSADIGVASVGAFLILSAPPAGLPTPSLSSPVSLASWQAALTSMTSYTPTVIGVGFSASVGVSILPIDISVMPGRTWTVPVVSR
jgi:hypothetical protein